MAIGKPGDQPTMHPVTSTFLSWRKYGAWWNRPAGSLAGFTLLLLIFAAPAWLMADELRFFSIIGDDFAYIAESRDLSTTHANLLLPHNTHIVPLFRLWTYTLILLAGGLARLQPVFAVASYFGLVAAMSVVGYFVKIETSRSSIALVAMVGLGISSVTMPSVTWYSAGQALWAGTAIVLTLILVRNWSIRGGRLRFFLVILSALAAPMIWTGGHVAGLAAAAYLLASGRPRALRGALELILITALAILVELILVRRELGQTTMVWEHHGGLWPRPIQAVLHSLQAIAEAIFLGNLGIGALTSPFQAGMLVLGVIGLWAWSTGWRRPHPLEATGATIVIFSYLMVYAFRGNLPFDMLRSLRWYHAIPQVGAILFMSGWWTGLTAIPKPVGGHRLSRRAWLIVLIVVLIQTQMQVPLADRFLLAAAPPMSDSERKTLPIAELQRLRAVYFLQSQHDRQLRALIRLDGGERVCARLGIGRETIRRTFGRLSIPGMPASHLEIDALDMMSVPPDRVEMDPSIVRSALKGFLTPEPEPRPFWLDPTEPWPSSR